MCTKQRNLYLPAKAKVSAENMDLVQGAVGRGRWRQSSLGGSPTAPRLGLVEKTCTFWDCRALRSTKGTSPECWGIAKALQQLLLLIPWVWAQAERSPKPKLTPKGEPGAPNLRIGASPRWMFLSTRAATGTPKRLSLWLPGGSEQTWAQQKPHVLLNPVSRSNSAPPSKNLSSAATAIPNRWVMGRRKGFFTANQEWEQSKEGVQAVRLEWHVDNRQESKQGTLPPSPTPTVRVCAALQRCT